MEAGRRGSRRLRKGSASVLTTTTQDTGVLATIGNTPLIQLNKLIPDAGFHVYGKLESLNPGGSIKDRVAYSMLSGLIERGELVPGRSVIVESTSGNLGIGLAQLCVYFGLRFVCVVDARTTEQNLSILRAYGAEVNVVTEVDPDTGEYLPARLRRVRELAATVPHAYWPNQYANPLNAAAHHRTVAEILSAVDGQLDYLFCATSSCGTLRGTAEYLRSQNLDTTIVAVDAEGSAIFGKRPMPRLIPGHGASVVPALFGEGLADRVMHISDLDCVRGCRRLVGTEAILAGGSSGAVVSALLRLAPEIPPGSTVALVLPDRGDRYLATVYSDDWVAEKFGVDAADINKVLGAADLREKIAC
ncbi:2,3-diaminopropionate biosynthesis protein SbnA [Pseudonocardiaceae bacterium YIM PH 21723]|nr:2,3-diaminopropionate biosynthesis protein SbnA [Pseudonocardiaceae bacterium YIM PH 21723]